MGPHIEGAAVRLRPVEVRDAAASIRLRNTPGFEVGLPRISADLARQEAWIASQRERDGDFYFCVESKAEDRIVGLIALVAEPTVSGEWSADGSWEWGRWASVSPNPRVAVEAAGLLIQFAVDLGVPGVWVRIQETNRKVLKFHEHLPYTESWTARGERFFRVGRDDMHEMQRRLGVPPRESIER